jgi:hypothetical protein
MVQYTIADFNSIKNNGFEYQLNTEVISILRDLHRHFKSNVEVIKPLNFKKTKLDFTRSNSLLSEEKKINPFTAIRLLLNKVSPKNYLDCVEKLNGMIEPFREESEFIQVAELVFEVASTNRFYTSLYSDIYSHLINLTLSTTSSLVDNPFYRHYNTVYEKFLEMFENMVYVDPNVDYDQFCLMNIANEKRKAMSTMFVCLMKNGMAPRENIENILRVLLEKTETFITEPNRVNEVDELVENINCLYSPPHHYELFHTKLQQLSTIKHKQFPSISSKTLFKLQDIAKKPKD